MPADEESYCSLQQLTAPRWYRDMIKDMEDGVTLSKFNTAALPHPSAAALAELWTSSMPTSLSCKTHTNNALKYNNPQNTNNSSATIQHCHPHPYLMGLHVDSKETDSK